MKLFDFIKKKDEKTLDIKEYKEKNELEKKTKRRSITFNPDDAVSPEGYYDAVSRRFGSAKVAVTIMLIGLIILAFTVYSDVFSEENFKYLIKNINVDTSGKIESFRDVVYSGADEAVFGNFRKDFVIASPNVLKLYDSNGGLSLKSSPSTNNPKLSIGQSCILLYDQGDRDFYIYNNYSKLFSGTEENPIIMGDMSDSGKFVLVTETTAYASRIVVYNENFIAIRMLNRNNPVTAIKLSDNGEYLAVATVKLEGVNYISNVTVFDLGVEAKAIISENIYNEIPAAVEFESQEEDNMGISVITDKAIRRYTLVGEQESVVIEGNSPLYFDINEKFAAYTVKNTVIDNSSTLYCVINKNMQVSFKKNFEEKIVDMKLVGDNVYVLTKTKLVKINSKGEETSISLEGDPRGMTVFSGGEVFIKYSGIFRFLPTE